MFESKEIIINKETIVHNYLGHKKWVYSFYGQNYYPSEKDLNQPLLPPHPHNIISSPWLTD
jgi:hypothetical protein